MSLKIKNKLKKFKSNQSKVCDSNVHIKAIKVISDINLNMEDRIEAIQFLIKLLEYGNLYV